MAAAAGISEASVRRIWRAHGLKPHLVETFKVSKDPRFAEKLEAVVGLLRIPAKTNTDSGGNANGIPGRRRTVLGA